MSDNSDQGGDDIFDNIDSFESDIKDPNARKNATDDEKPIIKNELVIQKHSSKNVIRQQTPPQQPTKTNNLLDQIPLPILEGAHSLGPDMKFGWKPEVDFESAPIPLYFNFVAHPMQTYYEEQAYQQNSTGNLQQQSFKIIYYGPRPKDSFDMHKAFVKPAENTYEFNFPKFYGLASAKAFYDSVFEDMMGDNGGGQGPGEMREFVGMSPDIEYNELHFNSNFENGNLDMVVKTADNTYDLFLRVDTNTRGHFNWFHFECSKTRKARTVRFNIVNMSKRESLYNHGMQINYWSQKKNAPSFCGWERGGSNIKYGRSRVNKEHSKGQKKKRYYCLSFDFTFEHDNDKVWFAYTIPYTYSMLIQYIKSISQEQRTALDFEKLNVLSDKKVKKRGRYLQDSVLCKSLGGVEVPLVTITNFEDPQSVKSKKVVFVQARIHPGETASSWIVHGLISFLISKNKVAQELRNRLVFKIVPMCNPDGVIIGNTRTTLIGKDMNRQYADPPPNAEDEDPTEAAAGGVDDPKLNPIPTAIKNLLAQLIKEDKDKIMSFWDIHQHSKKKSIFIYGPYFPLHTDKYLRIRIMPKLLSDQSEMFRFFSCRFRIDKYKENCARITIGKLFNIINCFTLECSSYGYINKDRQTNQFKEADLIDFGKSLAECVLEYCLIMERDLKAKEELKQRMKEKKKKRKPFLNEVQPGVGPVPSAKESKKKKEEGSGDESNLESDEVDSERSFTDSESESHGSDENEYQKKPERLPVKLSNDRTMMKEIEEEDKESFNDDDDDRFYSSEEDNKGGNSSPVTRPSDLKGLLKHKQKKSKFDLQAYSKDGQKRSKQFKTLDQLLKMIQTDIIHEEKFENDSNPSIGSSSSDTSESEDDDLDDADQQILKERILHAIQVFSRWSPNPKKEILKQKRIHKLSIENKSRASSRKSKGSESKRSGVSADNEIIFPFSKLEQRSTPNNHSPLRLKNKSVAKQNQKDIIDNFLKEFGIHYNSKISGSLSLFGNKLGNKNNDFSMADDDVLSTISNELLKQMKKKSKKSKKKKPSSDLLQVKSFGNQKKLFNGDFLQQRSQDFGGFSENSMRPQSSLVVGSARKVILQKYFQNQGSGQTPQGALTPIPNFSAQVKQKNSQEHPIESGQQQNASWMAADQMKPATQKIINLQLQDNHQSQNSHGPQIHNQRQRLEKKSTNVNDDQSKRDSHLLGYDNKIALLNQAIIQKKQQTKKVRKETSVQSSNIQIQGHHQYQHHRRRLSDYLQKNYPQPPLQTFLPQGPVKIPLPVKQNQSFSNKPAAGNQQLQQQSFDSITPPFISCQIHPHPNPIQAKKYHFSTRMVHSRGIKVNAATDTINQNGKEAESPLLSNVVYSRQFNGQASDLQQQLTNSHFNDSPLMQREEISTTRLHPANSLNTHSNNNNQEITAGGGIIGKSQEQTLLSDQSVLHLQQNMYQQQYHAQSRQIISSQSKASQLQLSKVMHEASTFALIHVNQVHKEQQKLSFKERRLSLEKMYQPPIPPVHYQSLQDEIDRTHQIGLHQWMRLHNDGYLPQKELLLLENNLGKQPNYQAPQSKSLQVSNLTSRRGSQSPSQEYKQASVMKFNGFEQPSEKDCQAKVQKYLKDFKPQANKNEEVEQIRQQQVIRGKTQSKVKKISDGKITDYRNGMRAQSAAPDIVIKNTYKQPTSRYNMFKGNNNNPTYQNQGLDFSWEAFEQKKSELVKQVMLNCGAKHLGVILQSSVQQPDYFNHQSGQGREIKERIRLSLNIEAAQIL